MKIIINLCEMYNIAFQNILQETYSKVIKGKCKVNNFNIQIISQSDSAKP